MVYLGGVYLGGFGWHRLCGSPWPKRLLSWGWVRTTRDTATPYRNLGCFAGCQKGHTVDGQNPFRTT